jgi:hypothetical protein
MKPPTKPARNHDRKAKATHIMQRTIATTTFYPVRFLLGLGIGTMGEGVATASLVFAYLGLFLICVASYLEVRFEWL